MTWGGVDEFWVALHHALNVGAPSPSWLNTSWQIHWLYRWLVLPLGVMRFYSISSLLKSLITFLLSILNVNNIKKRSCEDIFQILIGLIHVHSFQKTFTGSITFKIITLLLFLPLYFYFQNLNIIYFLIVNTFTWLKI